MNDIVKRFFVSLHVTLNGKPASISGSKNPFATVSCLDGSQSFSFAWDTVQRIVTTKQGKFKG